ncbi:MAG: permease-like cell division protein FtsX [Prevotella sp.]|nr:permease-like cell division protein FtsX [Prevotella sp.]
MGKKRKKSKGRSRLQGVTLCISLTMVLILLGLVMIFSYTAYNLSRNIKENFVVSLEMEHDFANEESGKMTATLQGKRYINSVKYLSSEDLMKEGVTNFGFDASEFEEQNPFTPIFELQMKANYANGDSLKWITKELKSLPKVMGVDFQADVIDEVNQKIRYIGLVLLAVAALLTIVSFVLINNTVRLSVYSRRFSIHTMKLVGASWGFIRAPFIRRAIGQGLISGILAVAFLSACIYAAYQSQRDLFDFLAWQILAIIGGIVILLGIIITIFCTHVSVNKFLRMKAGELYKI